MKSPVTEGKEGVWLSLSIQPNAQKSGWAGVAGGELKLKVKAPAIEGQANSAVLRFLADYFDIPKSQVSIVRGAKGRHKLVLLSGSSATLLGKAKALLTVSSAGPGT
jgi:uncharacterized protein (TIGR00251 family)